MSKSIDGLASNCGADPSAPRLIEQRNGSCIRSEIVEAVARGQVDPREIGDGPELLRWVWDNHCPTSPAQPLWNAWQAVAWVMTKDETIARKMGGAIELTSERGPVWLADRARVTCLIWEIERLQAAGALGPCIGIDAAFASISKASRNGDLPQLQSGKLDRVWERCARAVFFHSFDVMQVFPISRCTSAPGRPAGTGKDDEAALKHMASLIEGGKVKTINEAAKAALDLVALDSSNTQPDSIRRRLAGKYTERAEAGKVPLPRKPPRNVEAKLEE